MSIDQTIAYLAFVFFAAVTPGPSNVLVVAMGTQFGVIRGLPCLLGVTVGAGTLLGILSLGFGAVLIEQPRLQYVMKFGGAALLLWIAWTIATAPSHSLLDSKQDKPIGFLSAALLQWINPKSWVVSVSAAGAFLNTTINPYSQATVLAVLFIIVATPAVGAWLVSCAAISRFLSSESSGKTFKFFMGLLLAASVDICLF